MKHRRSFRFHISSRARSLCLAAFLIPAALSFRLGALGADEPPIDVERGKQLMRRFQAGEALSAEDQEYLNRVRQQMARGKKQGGKAASGQAADSGKGEINAAARDLVPLTQLTGTYKGEDGGLYGQGRNDPPDSLRAEYLKISEGIKPLDPDGKPSAEGKIGLISIGFSNTHLEFTEFKKTTDADPEKSARLVVVDGAIGSRSAVMWAYDGADVLSADEQARLDKAMDRNHMPKSGRKGSSIDKDTWPTLDSRIKAEGLSAAQVQVLFLKQVVAAPRSMGDFPEHARALEADMKAILIIARKRFPNLKIAYLTSRSFSGWSSTTSGSPEPFAYESAFAVRWLIQKQIKGDPSLNHDSAKGEATVPLLLWGPYLWAHGDTPRKLDGLTWNFTDVRSDDHMHPSDAGVKKFTALLLNYLKTDAGSSRWYLKPGVKPTMLPVINAAAPAASQTSQAGKENPAPTQANPGDPTFQLDRERVQRLMQLSGKGETLSADDQAYLNKAKQMIQQRQGGKKNLPPVEREPGVNDPAMLAKLVPLTEMTEKYHGEDGGLYGGGQNTPPAAQLAAAKRESAKIRPLDAEGNPSDDGKIVVLSVGLSNTTMEYSEFKKTADRDPQKSSRVVLVDGAQGGRPGQSWAEAGARFLPPDEVMRLKKEIETIADRMPKVEYKREWDVAEERMKAEGVTPKQVQVLWLKEGTPNPGRYGEFPGHARAMQQDMTDMVFVAKKLYPNLHVVYFSSRTFGGYAYDTRNPEPYAYENAFSVRWVILSQINGDPKVTYEGAPVLLWGPYLWAHGTIPRKSDGLVWERADATERDGMHPSQSGKKKVVDMLLNFFKTDPIAKGWFLKG